ncbi:MAG: ABC transporter substrate-binding protein [Planctomycetes bacterium]|nr:ABC transporter substrate-binding protein [Planctomycetota bacterium]
MLDTSVSSPHGAPLLRIASLCPAATEIVAALGATDRLVGVSHECDWPSEVRGRAVLTRARTDGSSRDVELAALADARPDVILTDVARTIDVGAARVVVLAAKNLAGVWRSIEAVADALGIHAHGAAVVATLQRRVEAVASRARRLPRHPRVLTIERIEPVTLGGNWIPELIRLAGGVAVGAQGSVLDLRGLQKLSPKPDTVVFAPRGLTIGNSLMEIAKLKELIGSVDWPASIDGEVYLCNGRAYFDRAGPRLVESLEILAACVHPFEFRDFATQHVLGFQRLGLRRAAVAAR